MPSTESSPRLPPTDTRPRVVIVGLDLPFGDLVMLMVKVAIAAIPAALILFILALGVGMLFAAVRSGFGF